jgi:hypothetical protein
MKMRDKLLKFYMDNPGLSVDIDYEDDYIREDYYTDLINEMTEDQLMEELIEAGIYEQSNQ